MIELIDRRFISTYTCGIDDIPIMLVVPLKLSASDESFPLIWGVIK